MKRHDPSLERWRLDGRQRQDEPLDTGQDADDCALHAKLGELPIEDGHEPIGRGKRLGEQAKPVFMHDTPNARLNGVQHGSIPKLCDGHRGQDERAPSIRIMGDSSGAQHVNLAQYRACEGAVYPPFRQYPLGLIQPRSQQLDKIEPRIRGRHRHPRRTERFLDAELGSVLGVGEAPNHGRSIVDDHDPERVESFREHAQLFVEQGTRERAGRATSPGSHRRRRAGKRLNEGQKPLLCTIWIEWRRFEEGHDPSRFRQSNPHELIGIGRLPADFDTGVIRPQLSLDHLEQTKERSIGHSTNHPTRVDAPDRVQAMG